MGVAEAQLHLFLVYALGGGEWPASRPGHFILSKQGGLQFPSGRCGQEKNLLLLQGFRSSDCPAHSLLVTPATKC
jgi:hypothetical protein